MFPDPLHPAVVHFPVVLAVLLPLTALGVFSFMRRRGPSRTAWLMVVVLAGMLAGSSWLAIETGEDQEETVESVLASETPLALHESRADQFLMVALAVLGLALLGLAPGRLGTGGRAMAVLASLALVPAGIRVGGSGGDLVYRHGAAQAYSSRSGDLGTKSSDQGPGEDSDDR